MGKSVNRYDPRNIETMELVYGTGYMSAGGDAEVARIVSGIKICDQQILDVGCGLGGAAISLVKITMRVMWMLWISMTTLSDVLVNSLRQRT